MEAEWATTPVQEGPCDRPAVQEGLCDRTPGKGGDHAQSRRPCVTSRDQLCLSTTIRGPGGTTMVKVLSHNLMGSIRAYKYKHSTTSARSTRPYLVLHDHKSIHPAEVDPHDQCGLTRPNKRSTRSYTAESSLEKIQGFPNLPRRTQQQTLTISATKEIFIPTEESLPSI